jgi:3-methylcrotonyl-CoA carboxylase alpha subunit
MTIEILVDGAARLATVAWGPGGAQVTVNGVMAAMAGPDESQPGGPAGQLIEVAGGAVAVAGGRQIHVALPRDDSLDARAVSNDGVVRAPMNGKVVATFVERGQRVQKGTRVALMEAMKMEHSLTAPIDGVVREVPVVAGAQAVEGTVIVRIEADKKPTA